MSNSESIKIKQVGSGVTEILVGDTKIDPRKCVGYRVESYPNEIPKVEIDMIGFGADLDFEKADISLVFPGITREVLEEILADPDFATQIANQEWHDTDDLVRLTIESLLGLLEYMHGPQHQVDPTNSVPASG